MPRCFIALNLPTETQAEFAKIQSLFKQTNPELVVTWVNPDLAHLNLHFLGDLDERGVSILKSELAALEGKTRPFLGYLGGIGAFPNLFNSRVLYINLQPPLAPNLFVLHTQIKNILQINKFPVDNRVFKPHFTLGRVKKQSNEIKNILTPTIKFEIKTFELMESVLAPHGPEYKIIKSYRL